MSYISKYLEAIDAGTIPADEKTQNFLREAEKKLTAEDEENIPQGLSLWQGMFFELMIIKAKYYP